MEVENDDESDMVEVTFGRQDFGRLRRERFLATHHDEKAVLFKYEGADTTVRQGEPDLGSELAAVCIITEADIARMLDNEAVCWTHISANEVGVIARAVTMETMGGDQ